MTNTAPSLCLRFHILVDQLWSGQIGSEDFRHEAEVLNVAPERIDLIINEIKVADGIEVLA